MSSIINYFHFNIFLIFIIRISVTFIMFLKFFFLLLSSSFNFYPVDYLDLKCTWLSIVFIYLSFSVLYFLNSLLPTFIILNIFRFFLIFTFSCKRILLRQQGRIKIRSFAFVHSCLWEEKIFQNRDFPNCSCESECSDWKKM